MLKILKKIVVIFDNHRKIIIVYYRMWFEFFQDIIHFKGGEFYLFSNQFWHYGWDYEVRKGTYKKIFKGYER